MKYQFSQPLIQSRSAKVWWNYSSADLSDMDLTGIFAIFSHFGEANELGSGLNGV